MARRPALIKRKPKTIRVTKSEAYLVNKKHLGDEPMHTQPMTKVEYIQALNWYNYMATTSEAKDYIITYLKELGRVADARKMKSIPDNVIPTTAAWLCRLLSRGQKIPMNNVQGFIDNSINSVLNKSVEEQPMETKTNVISIQDRVKERTHEIVGEIEGLIDDYLYKNEQFSLYTWLQSNSIPAAYSTAIIQKLSPVLEELIEAYEGKDEQLKEAYHHLKKARLKEIILFYNTMIEDASKYANVTKKTRAPRKPRVQSVEKKLKTFKFQKECNQFKIASINPEKIIGAQELWVFNTKYKTLTVFRALDRGGLDVKGTSIIKYDEKQSITMRTGHKPDDAIKKVLSGGKIILKKIDQELKHGTFSPRINENIILLRTQ